MLGDASGRPLGMRVVREPVPIDGITWEVAWIVPGTYAKRGELPFQGIEFRHGAMVRRVALSADDLPSVHEFRAMTSVALAALLERSEAAW